MDRPATRERQRRFCDERLQVGRSSEGDGNADEVVRSYHGSMTWSTPKNMRPSLLLFGTLQGFYLRTGISRCISLGLFFVLFLFSGIVFCFCFLLLRSAFAFAPASASVLASAFALALASAFTIAKRQLEAVQVLLQMTSFV